jgi:cellulose synthase/poly-beta-1,6-N-acetylglucosamine synthase-like glycosyltransferase
LAQDEAHRLFGPGQVSLQVTTDWDVSWAVQKHCRDRLLFDATGDLYRRQPDASAMVVVTRSQRWTGVGGLLALVLAAVAEPWALLTAVSLLVNVSFFAAVAMKSLTCVLGFFGHPGTHISDREARAIPDRDLPRYTILVPAYHEANVVAQLVANLKALDYPVDRLEILLLLEEDDPQTLAAVKAAAPSPMVRIVVVPDGQPKTKPKACNVGLAIATGDLLVIYDAEDRPDPDQLRKAATAFANSGPEVACVQARLTYSNVRDNALTRLFTLEYDAWFQLMLPVMDRLGLPIPLGGTSNHFRIEALRRLGGWDPHNVTEDADLGIRATELGYRVLVINSNTFEEANGAYGNWIRQRSRWIKGYMQTTLVHTRHPARLLRRCGLRAGVGLAFLIAGTPLTFLLAPLLWINTLMWVVTGYTMLPTIGGWGAALSGVSLIAGNALAVLASMLAALKRRQWFLLPWALLNPLYWVMHSMAAYRGAWQLIFRPFYWEKTRHGLTKTPPAAATVAVRTAAAAS